MRVARSLFRSKWLPAVCCGLAFKASADLSSLKKAQSMTLQLSVDGLPVANGAIVRGKFVVMVCDIAHSASLKNRKALLHDRDGEALDFEVVSYDEDSHLLVLKLTSADAISSLESTSIQQPRIQEGDHLTLLGVDCFGEQALDQVTVVDSHLKRYHDLHRVQDVRVPPIHSFKVNYKHSSFELDRSQPSRVAFNSSLQLAGVCRGDNLSVCYAPHQLQFVLDRIEKTGSLQKEKLGATVKTAQAGNGSLRSPGVCVYWIGQGGVLDRMGVKIGDVITSVNGNKIKSAAEFFQVVGFAPAQDLQLTVDRNERLFQLHL